MALPMITPYGAKPFQEMKFNNPWKGAGVKPYMTPDQLMGQGWGQLQTLGNNWRRFTPDDPMTGQWMNNYRGQVGNAVDQNTRAMANAGVAGSRGGMGVMGGMNPAARMAQQGTQQVAGMTADLYGRSLGHTLASVNVDNDRNRLLMGQYGYLLGAAGNLASNMYGTDMGAYTDWRRGQESADRWNAENWNRINEGDWSRAQQQLAQQRGLTDQQRLADQENAKNIAMNEWANPGFAAMHGYPAWNSTRINNLLAANKMYGGGYTGGW